MIQQEIVITDPQGVHALVAQELATMASTFASSLFLRHQGRMARMDEPMSILALGLRQGTSVAVWADGTDEVEALDAVVTVLTARDPTDLTSQHDSPTPGEPL